MKVRFFKGKVTKPLRRPNKLRWKCKGCGNFVETVYYDEICECQSHNGDTTTVLRGE